MSSARHLLTTVVAVIALLGFPLRSSPAAAGEASRALSLINSARASAGLGPLVLDGELSRIAQSHANRMAAENRVYHNPSFPGVAGSWEAWGENVGAGGDVDGLHRAFMGSSTHRSNILNSTFTRVGIGTAMSGRGLMIAQDFLKRPGDVAAALARPPAAPRSQPAAAAPARAPARAAAPPPPPPPPPLPPAPEPAEPFGCHWVGEPEA